MGNFFSAPVILTPQQRVIIINLINFIDAIILPLINNKTYNVPEIDINYNTTSTMRNFESIYYLINQKLKDYSALINLNSTSGEIVTIKQINNIMKSLTTKYNQLSKDKIGDKITLLVSNFIDIKTIINKYYRKNFNIGVSINSTFKISCSYKETTQSSNLIITPINDIINIIDDLIFPLLNNKVYIVLDNDNNYANNNIMNNFNKAYNIINQTLKDNSILINNNQILKNINDKMSKYNIEYSKIPLFQVANRIELLISYFSDIKQMINTYKYAINTTNIDSTRIIIERNISTTYGVQTTTAPAPSSSTSTKLAESFENTDNKNIKVVLLILLIIIIIILLFNNDNNQI